MCNFSSDLNLFVNNVIQLLRLLHYASLLGTLQTSQKHSNYDAIDAYPHIKPPPQTTDARPQYYFDLIVLQKN